MTDLSLQKPWPLPDADPPAGPDHFIWPQPPYAAYLHAQSAGEPGPCEILGFNAGRSTGRLVALDANERVVHILLTPNGASVPLKFSQFRMIQLAQPLTLPSRGQHGVAGSPVAALSLDQPTRSSFRVAFVGGGEVKGFTIGHQHDALGAFLFPPVSEHDESVYRVFIPREAIAQFEVGERIGDLLLKERLVTPDQLAEAAREQQELRHRRVGDILVEQHIVTAEQLLLAIEQQARMPMVRIGEALLALDLVKPEQLEQALAQQRDDRSVPLGELLVRRGFISRAQLQSALARKMGYPVVDVERFPVEPAAIRKLPHAVARRLDVLPLLVRDGRLVVAMEDPTRRDALDEIEFITQLKVVPTLGRLGAVQQAITMAFDRFGADALARPAVDGLADLSADFALDSSNKLIESLERDSSERAAREDEPAIEQSDNSLVRLINTMIIEAHAQGVSDIHIETYPGRDKLKIRFRRDGVLQPYLELPHTYRNAMIARIKIMCDLDISERRKPQDGKINFARFSPQHKLELRVATVPTNNGLEDVVMRILASSRPIPLERLGLAPANLAAVHAAVRRPYGMVLCVGPTGSGKTTTLHSALAHINTPERKIWTAEDPIEITQSGLRQVQVNPRIDWTFAKALRAFLRADPDVIMVGEIRDQETAEIAIEASLTGHLVLSTLHTNSAAETITRLLDMGMDPFNFADSLLAVVAQRLVRRCCTACQTAAPMTEAELAERLDDFLHVFPADARPDRSAMAAQWLTAHGRQGRLVTFTSIGCAACGGSGYRGRAGLHEVLTVTKALRRMIQTGARAEEIHHAALADGMHSLRQDGIIKVLQGVTTLAEVHATTNT
ncbi:GspE/PulE family protein [Roseateles cellulosilyticus]|uniref:Flp pilus assembly complex ATPase component TadA n=1 Tax=Pelomonas cellulosilytica TaxID=2906762 RepID=A0ABS8XVQ3_9BURK|nr:ATPase, T2SS/T4P/T4SS family [Pelomonas sp. P8]MCE4555862.1 Flp pilus assembly complex ATPase component TadA [Pelomonas sp. P8]